MTTTMLIDAAELIAAPPRSCSTAAFPQDPNAGRAWYLAGHVPGAYLDLNTDLSRHRQPARRPSSAAGPRRLRGATRPSRGGSRYRGGRFLRFAFAGASRLWWLMRSLELPVAAAARWRLPGLSRRRGRAPAAGAPAATPHRHGGSGGRLPGLLRYRGLRAAQGAGAWLIDSRRSAVTRDWRSRSTRWRATFPVRSTGPGRDDLGRRENPGCGRPAPHWGDALAARPTGGVLRLGHHRLRQPVLAGPAGSGRRDALRGQLERLVQPPLEIRRAFALQPRPGGGGG